MITTLLPVCFVAALLELDTTYAFQLLVSRPIIVGPLLGLLTGNALIGLQVGIFAELLFSDISPLGGIIPPSGVVAAALPIILYASGIEVYFGFFLGILAAFGYSFLDAFLRKTRFTWLVFSEKAIYQKPATLSRIIMLALLSSFLMTFVFLSLVSWISIQILWITMPHITQKMHLAFQLAYSAVPWIGLATLIPSFRLKMR